MRIVPPQLPGPHPNPLPGGEGAGCPRSAFTLIELLVVLGIISMLLAILLPAVRAVRQQAASVNCLSNLRQLATATRMYAHEHRGSFPIAYYTVNQPPVVISYAWDFTTIRNTSTGEIRVEPGLIWQGQTEPRVHQCPTFDGRSNTPSDPYTGYNYNTSYIGGGQFEIRPAPARIAQVRRPSQTALFGDGEYRSGANKFMRSPFPSPGDGNLTSRSAGTQGFRHRGRTNVVYVDGHAASVSERHTQTLSSEIPRIAPGTGFLSSDNSAYSLD